MYRLAVSILFLVVISACQTTQSKWIGEGPIDLSPRVQACYGSYLKTFRPEHFAVAIDGRSSCGYWFCDSPGCAGRSSEYSAVKTCEARSRGVPCKIYAIGEKIVWRTAGTPGKLTPLFPATSHETKTVDVDWSGVGEGLEGRIMRNPYEYALRKSSLIIVAPAPYAYCRGEYNLAENWRSAIWEVKCANGVQASGKFTVDEQNKITGSGTASDGSDLEISG